MVGCSSLKGWAQVAMGKRVGAHKRVVVPRYLTRTGLTSGRRNRPFRCRAAQVRVDSGTMATTLG